jgi:hypothetical protein
MGRGSGVISPEQRRILTDRLYDAAVENVSKAHTPPTGKMQGEYPSASAKAHAEAARALVQALTAVTAPAGGRR